MSFPAIGAFEKFRDFQPKSSKPATEKIKNNLMCSVSHLASNEVSLRCKKLSDDRVVLVLGYDFKSRIKRHLLTVDSF